MSRFKTFSTLILFIFVSACDPTSQSTALRNEPGPKAVTSMQAATLFDKACFSNAPQFTGTYPYLRSTRNFNLGTDGLYYHKTLNLSILVHDLRGFKVCSMVFFPDERFDTTLQQVVTYFTRKNGATGEVFKSKEIVGGVILNQDPTRNVLIDSTDESPVMRLLVQRKL